MFRSPYKTVRLLRITIQYFNTRLPFFQAFPGYISKHLANIHNFNTRFSTPSAPLRHPRRFSSFPVSAPAPPARFSALDVLRRGIIFFLFFCFYRFEFSLPNPVFRFFGFPASRFSSLPISRSSLRPVFVRLIPPFTVFRFWQSSDLFPVKFCRFPIFFGIRPASAGLFFRSRLSCAFPSLFIPRPPTFRTFSLLVSASMVSFLPFCYPFPPSISFRVFLAPLLLFFFFSFAFFFVFVQTSGRPGISVLYFLFFSSDRIALSLCLPRLPVFTAFRLFFFSASSLFRILTPALSFLTTPVFFTLLFSDLPLPDFSEFFLPFLPGLPFRSLLSALFYVSLVFLSPRTLLFRFLSDFFPG